MSKLGPTREEVEALRAKAPTHGPILVVNLLKLKPGPTARAAYLRYLEHARPAAHPDCEVIHTGPAFHDFGAGEDWDYVIIARYPRFEDFAQTVTHDTWQDAAGDRPDALEKTLMIVTPVGNAAADFAA